MWDTALCLACYKVLYYLGVLFIQLGFGGSGLGWMNEMNEWMDGWMDGWTDGRTDGWDGWEGEGGGGSVLFVEHSDGVGRQVEKDINHSRFCILICMRKDSSVNSMVCNATATKLCTSQVS